MTQEDYENINTGPILEFDYKYSNMIVVVYLVMLYGSGIPILYLIGAIFFFVTYWVDKWLIFYNHRKPSELDEKLTLQVLGLFKYAVILHFIGGILMYSNAAILPVPAEDRAYQVSRNVDDLFTFG